MTLSPTPTPPCASMPCASHSRSSRNGARTLDFDGVSGRAGRRPRDSRSSAGGAGTGDRCRDEPAALDALGKIAAQDADDPWIRLAILSGLAESSLAFLPLCDQVPPASGRAQLLSQAAAIVGVRRRPNELSTLLRMIASRVDQKQVKSGPVRSVDALTMLAGLATGLERSGPPLSALIAMPPLDLKPDLARLAPLWPAASAIAVSKRSVAERSGGTRCPVARAARSRRGDHPHVACRHTTGRDPVGGRTGRRSRWPALARGKSCSTVGSLSGSTTRRELLSAVAGSRELAEELIKALEQSTIGPNELDASTREALERLPDATLRRRASTVFAKFTPPRRSEAVARYQAALIARCRRATRRGCLRPQLPDVSPAPGPGSSRRP